MAHKNSHNNKRWYYLFTVLAVLFVYVLIVNAWVVDDAYTGPNFQYGQVP